MMKRFSAILLAVFLLIALTACGGRATAPEESGAPVSGEAALPAEPTAPPESEAAPPPPEEALPPEKAPPEPEPKPEPDPRQETIDAIVSRMTLEELVGQLFFVRCPASRQAELVSQYHLGQPVPSWWLSPLRPGF